MLAHTLTHQHARQKARSCAHRSFSNDLQKNESPISERFGFGFGSGSAGKDPTEKKKNGRVEFKIGRTDIVVEHQGIVASVTLGLLSGAISLASIQCTLSAIKLANIRRLSFHLARRHDFCNYSHCHIF